MTPEEEAHAQEIVTEAYALVGAVATGFSTIEFHLQFLLSLLISGKVLAPEAMLTIRQKQFNQRIELLRDLVILRLPADSHLRHEGMKLVSALNSLRETRNLYIHGYWLINYILIISTGGVRCSDPRWKFNKKDESWNAMNTQDISLQDLKKQIEDTGEIYKQIHVLMQQIEKQTPQPYENTIYSDILNDQTFSI